MNRRTFLISSGAAGVATLLGAPAVGDTAETDSAESPGIPANFSLSFPLRKGGSDSI